MMAQRLYEAGYITYMRTDSTNLSADAIGMVRGFIEDEFGQKVPAGQGQRLLDRRAPRKRTRRSVLPTSTSSRPSCPAWSVTPSAWYDLIWRQFVACQMTPAEYPRPA